MPKETKQEVINLKWKFVDWVKANEYNCGDLQIADWWIDKLSTAISDERERIKNWVEKNTVVPRHYCNCDECHHDREMIRKEDIIKSLTTE